MAEPEMYIYNLICEGCNHEFKVPCTFTIHPCLYTIPISDSDWEKGKVKDRKMLPPKCPFQRYADFKYIENKEVQKILGNSEIRNPVYDGPDKIVDIKDPDRFSQLEIILEED